MAKATTLIYLAGIDNSGPGHWQRLWQQQHGGYWVQHDDWNAPMAHRWLDDLAQTVEGQAGRLVLIGHSLGALLAAQWLSQGGRADAAFLVALPDVKAKAFPKNAGGFVDARLLELKLPVRLVYSRNDPFASESFSKDIAARWKAQSWDLGDEGHINADTTLGTWPEGWRDMKKFLKGLPK